MTKARRAAIHAELRDLMANRLNVRGRSFPAAVRRAGRLLPAPARKAAAQMAEIEARLDHPRLAARTDPAALEHAARVIRGSLTALPRGARRARDRALLMGEIGFKLAVLIALGLAALHWQMGA